MSFTRQGFGQIVRRIWLLWGFHNLSLLAAGVAFFGFLAITPLIASIVLIYGLVADVATVQHQMQTLTRVIPADAASVLEGQLIQVVTTSSTVTGVGLVIALALAIYGAMYAANGLIAALNVINSELETRGLVTLTRRALGLTFAADDDRFDRTDQRRRVCLADQPLVADRSGQSSTFAARHRLDCGDWPWAPAGLP